MVMASKGCIPRAVLGGCLALLHKVVKVTDEMKKDW